MDVFATFIRPYEKIKTDMTGIIINKGGAERNMNKAVTYGV